MLVKIIGCHGGSAPGFRTTSYLIDDNLLIDAGSVAQGLNVDGQALIDNILISHPHLDHIGDLAFMCDNCFGMRDKPFEVYGNRMSIDAFKNHLMNDVIWPDFSKIPNEENPTVRFNLMKPDEVLSLGGFNITPVRVNHNCEALGFIIEKNKSAVLFTQDTGPTEKIWEVGKRFKNLKAIFTEVSFPNAMQNVADLSFHHTPQSLAKEVEKMPKDIPIFVGHLKPAFQKILFKEIDELGISRLSILGSDNSNYVL